MSEENLEVTIDEVMELLSKVMTALQSHEVGLQRLYGMVDELNAKVSQGNADKDKVNLIY